MDGCFRCSLWKNRVSGGILESRHFRLLVLLLEHSWTLSVLHGASTVTGLHCGNSGMEGGSRCVAST